VNELNQAVAHLDPCPDAVSWLETQDSQQGAWENCERGDWMLTIFKDTSNECKWRDDRKQLVLCVCECARLALPYASDVLPLRCIETTEAWARGEMDHKYVESARLATIAKQDCRWLGTISTAECTMECAAAAARTAEFSDWAPDVAGWVGAAAAQAASKAAWNPESPMLSQALSVSAVMKSAIHDVLRQCAGIVRKYFPDPPTLKELRSCKRQSERHTKN